MPYTAYATATVGQILTAAFWNAQVRDNGLLGPEALATADGEVWIATGANAGEMVAILQASNFLKLAYGGLEFDANAVTTGDAIVGQSAGLMGLETAMSQAQAEAGTETQVRGVTAQRIKQAIDALSGVTQATQAALEAETNENTYAPPDLIKHNPSIAKVWVKWEQTGAHSILSSYNMTSVTDGGGTGDTDHLWANDFSSAEYALIGLTNVNTSRSTIPSPDGSTFLAGGVTTFTRDTAGVLTDADHNAIVGYGDQ